MEEAWYIDANVFILAALNQGEDGSKAKLFLRYISEKKLRVYTCTLTFDEFSYKVLKSKEKKEAHRLITAFFNLPFLTFIDVTTQLTWKAFDLIKQYNLDPRDAIHAASAIQAGIKIIVSEDKDFGKVKELKRINLKGIKG